MEKLAQPAAVLLRGAVQVAAEYTGKIIPVFKATGMCDRGNGFGSI